MVSAPCDDILGLEYQLEAMRCGIGGVKSCCGDVNLRSGATQTIRGHKGVKSGIADL